MLASLLIGCNKQIRITDGPDARLASPTSIEVRWTTDTPSDSSVFYGSDDSYGLRVTDAAQTMDHRVILPNLASRQPYKFKVVSARYSKSAEGYGMYWLPDRLASVEFPTHQSLAFGTITLNAAPTDSSINVKKAEFYYRPTNVPESTLIGTDTDGTGQYSNCFQPAPSGDGWSTSWDTSKVPRGSYEIIARLYSDLGTFDGSTSVYVDQTPPIPTITAPRFGEEVSGLVPIEANRGPGVRALFEVKPQPLLLSFAVDPTNQHDYKYDRNNGNSMCDPSSQAGILWAQQKVKDKLRAHPACKGKRGAQLDECAKRLLVQALAKSKNTGPKGTDYGDEKEGSNAILQALGLSDWRFENSGAMHDLNFKELKTFLTNKPRVKGAVIHAHKARNPNGIGHVLAIVSVNDRANANGKHEIRLMDPDTGNEVTVELSDKADEHEFTYGGEQWIIDSAGRFVDPPPEEGELPQLRSSDEGWKTVAVSANGSRGWQAIWNTRGFAPGLYWVRVTVFSAQGYRGSDQVEVSLR